MLIRRLLFAVASGALALSASTISFLPSAQTIALGATTTVDVQISGLSVNQALGAFDLDVLNFSSIVTPTSIVFLNSLGNPGLELTGSTLGSATAEAAETSFESTATLLGLQSGQPFSLFRLTYTAVGVGTSPLFFASNPMILADGAGVILPVTIAGDGSITVVGTTPDVPEPSTYALLGGGFILLLASRRFRSASVVSTN